MSLGVGIRCLVIFLFSFITVVLINRFVRSPSISTKMTKDIPVDPPNNPSQTSMFVTETPTLASTRDPTVVPSTKLPTELDHDDFPPRRRKTSQTDFLGGTYSSTCFPELFDFNHSISYSSRSPYFPCGILINALVFEESPSASAIVQNHILKKLETTFSTVSIYRQFPIHIVTNILSLKKAVMKGIKRSSNVGKFPQRVTVGWFDNILDCFRSSHSDAQQITKTALPRFFSAYHAPGHLADFCAPTVMEKHSPFELTLYLNASVSISPSSASPLRLFYLLDSFDVLLVPLPGWELLLQRTGREEHSTIIDMSFHPAWILYSRTVNQKQSANEGSWLSLWRDLVTTEITDRFLSEKGGHEINDEVFSSWFIVPFFSRTLTEALRRESVTYMAVDPFFCVDRRFLGGLGDFCTSPYRFPQKLRRKNLATRKVEGFTKCDAI